MEKNKIQSKGMRTLNQEELNATSGGGWALLGIAAAALLEIFRHRKDKDAIRREGMGP